MNRSKEYQLELGLTQNNENSTPEGQLDFGLIKPERTATILITVPYGESIQTTGEGLRSTDGVGDVFLVAGDFTFEVAIYDRDIDEISQIRSQLQSIQGARIDHTLVTMHFPERGMYTDITKVE